MEEDTTADTEDAEEASRLVKLDLLNNAYDFIEESLRYAEMAVEDPPAWKFSIILAAQGIELLLKARLAREHPLLVLSNPDKPGQGLTVGVESAVARLTAAGVSLASEDVERLRRAHRLRNEFVHYEVNATVGQLRGAYADLFEFAHVFHLGEFGSELHDHLDEGFYVAEAMTMENFRREFITYQGEEVSSRFPAEIVDAQFALRIRVGDELYERIRRGSPDDFLGERENPCHDCSVVKGQLHASYCDSERCPKCRGQLLTCGCAWSWEYADEIPHFVPTGIQITP